LKLVSQVLKGFEDEVIQSMDKLLDEYEITNLIVEMKKIRNLKVKRAFVNRMISKGYKVYSYWEKYDGTPLMVGSGYEK